MTPIDDMQKKVQDALDRIKEFLTGVSPEAAALLPKVLTALVTMTSEEFINWVDNLIDSGDSVEAYATLIARMDDAALTAEIEKLVADLDEDNASNRERVAEQEAIIKEVVSVILTLGLTLLAPLGGAVI